MSESARVRLAVLFVVFLAACPRSEPEFDLVRPARTSVSSEISAIGTLQPQVGAEVKVGPRISGTLKRLHARVGDPVRAGQLLAELSDDELRADLDRFTAAERDAAARLERARAALARRKALVAGGVSSADDLEAAEQDWKVAVAAADRASSDRRRAAIQLSYAKLYAPIGGVVSSISTQEGETVAASFAAPTFVTIVDLSRLELLIYIDEVDVGRVVPGQKVTFTVDAYPSRTFSAVVRSIQPAAIVRDNVVNYAALAEIAGATAGQLRPNMTATVTIPLQGTQTVLTVPAAAVRTETGVSYVMVSDGRSGLTRRTVTTGERINDQVRIKEGVAEADLVAVPRAQAGAAR